MKKDEYDFRVKKGKKIGLFAYFKSAREREIMRPKLLFES